MRLIAAICMLAASGAAAANSPRECFTGYASNLESGAFVYTEHHQRTYKNGRPVEWQVTYRTPEGEVMARKTLDFSANRFVPTYQLKIPDEGYREGIERTEEGGWRMFRRETTNAARDTRSFKVNKNTAADSGFDPFVKGHLNTLMTGETVTFSFGVAGRQSVVDMKARRIDDTTFEGERAVQFKASLDMFLVNWFVDSIKLTYDPDTRALLEYRGISNMHNEAGDTYPVRVSYYSEPPDDLPDSVTTRCDDQGA